MRWNALGTTTTPTTAVEQEQSVSAESFTVAADEVTRLDRRGRRAVGRHRSGLQ